jgi:hypothetical protein
VLVPTHPGFAKAIPGARFLLLPEAGHLPQFEAPGRLLGAVWDFAEATAAGGRDGLMCQRSHGRIGPYRPRSRLVYLLFN